MCEISCKYSEWLPRKWQKNFRGYFLLPHTVDPRLTYQLTHLLLPEQRELFHADLMLIRVDSVDGRQRSRRVQTEEDLRCDDAELIAQHRPAEVDEVIKRNEAENTDAD